MAFAQQQNRLCGYFHHLVRIAHQPSRVQVYISESEVDTGFKLLSIIDYRLSIIDYRSSIIYNLFPDAELTEDSVEQFVGGDGAGEDADVVQGDAHLLGQQVGGKVALQPVTDAPDGGRDVA